jgi:hypothetical protein
MAPELWVPGAPAPSLEDFVEKIRHTVEQFATERGLDQAYMEVRLHDGTNFGVHSLRADPGYGFITLCPYPEDVADGRGADSGAGDPLPPEELVVPVGSIARITLRGVPADEPGFGFGLSEESPKGNA